MFKPRTEALYKNKRPKKVGRVGFDTTAETQGDIIFKELHDR